MWRLSSGMRTAGAPASIVFFFLLNPLCLWCEVQGSGSFSTTSEVVWEGTRQEIQGYNCWGPSSELSSHVTTVACPHLCSLLGLGHSNTKLAGYTQHSLLDLWIGNLRLHWSIINIFYKAVLVYKHNLLSWKPCWFCLAPFLQIHHALNFIKLS